MGDDNTEEIVNITIPGTTYNRLFGKFTRAESKLKRDLRKAKSLLPIEQSRDFLITPDSSLVDVHLEAGAQPPKERIPSDVSTRTLHSDPGDGGAQVSPLPSIPERGDLSLSASTSGSVCSRHSTTNDHNDRWSTDPFFTHGQLKALDQSYSDFEKYVEPLLNATVPSDPSHRRLVRKEEHYGILFERITSCLEVRIVELCGIQELPLPGTPTRWTQYRVQPVSASHLTDHGTEVDGIQRMPDPEPSGSQFNLITEDNLNERRDTDSVENGALIDLFQTQNAPTGQEYAPSNTNTNDVDGDIEGHQLVNTDPPTDPPALVTGVHVNPELTVIRNQEAFHPSNPLNSLPVEDRRSISFVPPVTAQHLPRTITNNGSLASVRHPPLVNQPTDGGPTRQVILEVALNQYTGCKRSILSTLQAISSTVLGKTSVSCTMSAGIMLQLDDVRYKLDVNLPDLYLNLCNNTTGPQSGYSEDFNNFIVDSNSELARLRMCVLGLTVEVTISPTELTPIPPRVVAPKLDSRYLPRLDALKFSGKIEDFPEFKRSWMAQFGHLDNDTKIQYLKPSLPYKDQSKVSAVTSVADCWKRLGRVYGDRQVNILTVKNNLKSFQLKGG